MSQSIDPAKLTPEIAARLRTAVELGKWADGSSLTKEQKETCIQALIIYDYSNKTNGERIGDITASSCGSKPADIEEIATLKWADKE